MKNDDKLTIKTRNLSAASIHKLANGISTTTENVSLAMNDISSSLESTVNGIQEQLFMTQNLSDSLHDVLTIANQLAQMAANDTSASFADELKELHTKLALIKDENERILNASMELSARAEEICCYADETASMCFDNAQTVSNVKDTISTLAEETANGCLVSVK